MALYKCQVGPVMASLTMYEEVRGIISQTKHLCLSLKKIILRMLYEHMKYNKLGSRYVDALSLVLSTKRAFDFNSGATWRSTFNSIFFVTLLWWNK